MGYLRRQSRISICGRLRRPWNQLVPRSSVNISGTPAAHLLHNGLSRLRHRKSTLWPGFRRLAYLACSEHFGKWRVRTPHRFVIPHHCSGRTGVHCDVEGDSMRLLYEHRCHREFPDYSNRIECRKCNASAEYLCFRVFGLCRRSQHNGQFQRGCVGTNFRLRIRIFWWSNDDSVSGCFLPLHILGFSSGYVPHDDRQSTDSSFLGPSPRQRKQCRYQMVPG